MRIFFTSTCQGSLGNKVGEITYPMEQTLKESLGDYGEGLSEWFLMFVILGPGTPGHDAPERVMWKKKTRDLDQRLNVDFEAFKSGSKPERQALLLATMRRSLDNIINKKLPDFDAERLKQDFEDIVSREGWE